MPREPIPIRNPRTGQTDGAFQPVEAGALADRCAALRDAQAGWRDRGVDGRAAVMASWREAILQRRDALIAALSEDTGRQRESGLEVDAVLGMIDRWTQAAPGLLAEKPPQQAAIPFLQIKGQTVPYPLVGVISPWNFPLLLSLIDAIPALMAGCAVMIKPSEITPRFVAPLRETVAAVPALAAVLEIVLGDGETGAALIGCVDAICFTGSVPTGRKVAAAAAARFIPAFLELGGKDPALVLDSADLDMATSAILWGATSNAGQACQSIERVYVAKPVYEDFVARITARAARLKLLPEGGPIGPIISAAQIAIIRDHLDDAMRRGAVARTGGVIENHEGGSYCRPTVLTGVDHSMKVMTEETFGPIIPVMPFATVEEGLRLANDTQYGLSAAVFAGTHDEAEAVGRRIEAGAISINDAALTAMSSDGEKHSFKFSGLGGSRMGPASIFRFVRKQALIVKQGTLRDPWWFAEIDG